MRQIFKSFSVFAISYLILQMIVIGMLYAYPKLELHLLMNAYHNGVLDIFFKYFSTLAEWPLYFLALLPLFWKKWRITLFYALSELTAGAVLQIMKHLISMDRPLCVFEKYSEVTLPLVADVDMHYGNSFPSGHASTFFVFCTSFALILTYYFVQEGYYKRLGARIEFSALLLLLVSFATLGAYSRVYLSQHFLTDACVGSLIGFVAPLLIFYFGRKKILKLDL